MAVRDCFLVSRLTEAPGFYKTHGYKVNNPWDAPPGASTTQFFSLHSTVSLCSTMVTGCKKTGIKSWDDRVVLC